VLLNSKNRFIPEEIIRTAVPILAHVMVRRNAFMAEVMSLCRLSLRQSWRPLTRDILIPQDNPAGFDRVSHFG
jgi:hypothetical protein